jgi:hypothetical protein
LTGPTDEFALKLSRPYDAAGLVRASSPAGPLHSTSPSASAGSVAV